MDGVFLPRKHGRDFFRNSYCLTVLLSARIRFSRTTLKWSFGIGALLLIFALGFSRTAKQWGLNSLGLDMTILAIGTCMLILASDQSRWQAPRVFYPLLKLGERSYEIYLTHMFVILTFFHLFLLFGKPIKMIPGFFLISILASLFLGELVGRYYTGPLNVILRKNTKKKIQENDSKLLWPAKAD